MTKEEKYIKKRLFKAFLQSLLFYFFRLIPINKRKIVFTCIEGTTGYTCNPKYIAEELIRQRKNYILVWLVNDLTKKFPPEIMVKKNNLWNRAYQLSTAHIWIDNSRKQLEVRKRKGQVYIQTWHAKIGFKPTCLDRGASFTKIAYLVSKHDSDMIDYWLSNSDWYDKTLKTGSLYTGTAFRSGSPRCDILINDIDSQRKKVREFFNIALDSHILMYAPTFRGGNENTNRTVEVGNHFPDYQLLKKSLEARFGGTWYILLRLHPQIMARKLAYGVDNKAIIDASKVDDMYEILAGCDAFITDYSSAAFDAAVMRIPIFLYADDYSAYERERGSLLWNLRELPFPLAETDDELKEQILNFDDKKYQEKLKDMFEKTGMKEDGRASKRVVDLIEETINEYK